MNQPVIGIDPGLTGAIALLTPEDSLYVYDLPVLKARGGKNTLDMHQLNDLLQELTTRSPKLPLVVLEEVASMPKQGVVSTFTFGKTAGQIEGLIVGHGLKLQMIRPAVWKKAMSVSADKDTVRLQASRAFPEFAQLWPRKKDHGRAEAALIALFGRRFYP